MQPTKLNGEPMNGRVLKGTLQATDLQGLRRRHAVPAGVEPVRADQPAPEARRHQLLGGVARVPVQVPALRRDQRDPGGMGRNSLNFSRFWASGTLF